MMRVLTKITPLLAGLLLLTPVALLAAGGPSADPWGDLMYKAINFAILVGLLVFFLRKPISGFFRGSAADGRRLLEETRKRAEEAENELARQKEKITGLQAELERLRAEAQGEAKANQERMTQLAREQAERITQQTQQQVEQEVTKARHTLRSELAAQTMKLAEEMLNTRLDDKQRDTLVDNSIDRLGGSQ